MRNRWRDWLMQAEEDLLWARETLKNGRFSQACFAAQQVGEKAIKALALRRGNDEIRSHSIREIAAALEINGEVEAIAKRLDLYYISARYPDAFPSGAPFEYFTEDQAREAVDFAGRLVSIVRRYSDATAE